MKIKRFRASNIEKALCLVKAELGEDAVIIDTVTMRQESGQYVEVVAALDETHVEEEGYGNTPTVVRGVGDPCKDLFGEGKKWFALVGPSGAGKTTILMKMAFRFSSDDRRGMVINADYYRPYATEILGRFSRIIGCRFAEVREPKALLANVSGLNDDSFCLLDLPGINIALPGARERLQRYFWAVPGLMAIVVLPLNMHFEDIQHYILQVKGLPVQSFVITKTDEVNDPGRLKRLIVEFDLPISLVSCSPEIGEGLIPLSHALQGRSMIRDEGHCTGQRAVDVQVCFSEKREV